MVDFDLARRTTERVMRFVLEANHRHAKFSARLLAKSRNSEDICADIVDVCPVPFRMHPTP